MNSTQAGKAADNICTNQNPVLKTHMASLMGQENEIPLFSCVCHEPQSETGVFIYYKCYPHSQIGLA